jgi:hypothetical protein
VEIQSQSHVLHVHIDPPPRNLLLLRRLSLVLTGSNNSITCNLLPDALINLLKIGLKPIPLSSNHIPAVNWGQIYNDPEYWTPESLLANHSKFSNVATTMGSTHIKDKDGLNLNLNCLDVDSEYVSRLLSIPLNLLYLEIKPELKAKIQTFALGLEIIPSGMSIESISILSVLQKVTYVTKTRKPCGYHLYWLSRNKNSSIPNHKHQYR